MANFRSSALSASVLTEDGAGGAGAAWFGTPCAMDRLVRTSRRPAVVNRDNRRGARVRKLSCLMSHHCASRGQKVLICDLQACAKIGTRPPSQFEEPAGV